MWDAPILLPILREAEFAGVSPHELAKPAARAYPMADTTLLSPLTSFPYLSAIPDLQYLDKYGSV